VKLNYLFVLAICFAMSFLPQTVIAQENSNTITYGETLVGEISNREFEIEYRFTGSAGDVIVLEMQPAEVLGDLDHPVIMVLDTDYTPLWDAGSYGSAVLAAVLPYDGEYVILATRSDGRAGDSVGEYTLTLSNLPVIEPGALIEGEVSSEGVVYHAVDATAGPFSINYQKTSGEFFPEILVNDISEAELDEIASMSGTFVSATMTIDPAYVSGDVLVISLHEGLWDWNFDEVTATYTLTIEQRRGTAKNM